MTTCPRCQGQILGGSCLQCGWDGPPSTFAARVLELATTHPQVAEAILDRDINPPGWRKGRDS